MLGLHYLLTLENELSEAARESGVVCLHDGDVWEGDMSFTAAEMTLESVYIVCLMFITQRSVEQGW